MVINLYVNNIDTMHTKIYSFDKSFEDVLRSINNHKYTFYKNVIGKENLISREHKLIPIESKEALFVGSFRKENKEDNHFTLIRNPTYFYIEITA